MQNHTTASSPEPRVQREGVETPRALWTEFLAVAVFCAFFFFYGLGSFGLTGADEPRYAQIAREMLARHDWITPVLNGVPWMEKPVLYYWGAILSYSVFGVSDWAARLPSAVLATAIVAAIYFFMRRFRPGAQLDAALMAASSAVIIGFGRAASTDMPLAATFTVAMLAWYAWLETARRRWLVAFYVFVGLATLAKGPVAPFLAALIIVIFALSRREPRLILRTLWGPAVLAYFVVAAPWYALVQARNPQFVQVFFVSHNLDRFAQDVFHHRQPFWYYGPVLLLAMMPWTVYAVMAIVRGFRPGDSDPKSGGAPRAEAPEKERTRSLPRFLLIWLFTPLVFFSLSQSKLPGYILPGGAAFALLLADHLRTRTAEKKPNLALVLLHSAGAAMLLGAALLTPYLVLKATPTIQARTVAGVGAAVLFIAMALTLRRRGLRMLRFVTLVPVILGLAFVIRVAGPALDEALSERPVWRELGRINTVQMPLAVFQARREVEYGLNFYANHSIPRYERGEVPAGQHLVVVPAGMQQQLQALALGRRVTRVGEFPPQRLEFFWVSAPGAAHEHHGG